MKKKKNFIIKKLLQFFRFISIGKIKTIFYLKGKYEKSSVWGGVITFTWLTIVFIFAIRLLDGIFGLEHFNLATSTRTLSYMKGDMNTNYLNDTTVVTKQKWDKITVKDFKNIMSSSTFVLIQSMDVQN